MKELLSIEDPIAGLLGAWSAGLNLGSALLRIALIVALAASIGCERSSKRHSAGLRTFVLAAFSATVSMLLDQYVYVLLGCKLPLLSAATLLAVTSVSANSILFSSRGQIKGLTTSAGLVSCCILGFATGAGLYTLTLIVYVFLLCILAGFPAFEAYLKNRSNHFEVHMELKSSSYLRDFVTVSRRLGLRIDDIEANQAYAGSGLSVYSVSLTICSQELKKYKTTWRSSRRCPRWITSITLKKCIESNTVQSLLPGLHRVIYCSPVSRHSAMKRCILSERYFRLW